MGSKQLQDKVVVITGAASGIGQACAVRFAEEGANLVLADIQPCDKTVALVSEVGAKAIDVKVDTTSEADCNNMVSEAVAAFGRIDCGVFAAGILHEQLSLLEMDMALFEKVQNINLAGVLRSVRSVSRRLVEQGTGGSIVNIASTAGKIPIPGSGPYCVAKAGLIMMTKVLSLELIDAGVRVNALAPGFTTTPLWNPEEESEEHKWAMSITPMKRPGTPREQAEACLFLLSDNSSFTTGQTLFSAGGQFVG